jgi:hypothetical protein
MQLINATDGLTVEAYNNIPLSEASALRRAIGFDGGDQDPAVER